MASAPNDYRGFPNEFWYGGIFGLGGGGGGEEGGGVEEGSGANLLTTIVDICVKADL
jgi:hypothetical protein